MPPVAAALLPHPPLLVPELAGAAAAELDPLREACLQALETVLAAAPTTILVGPGPAWATPNPAATGSFHPYGASIEVTLPAPLDPTPAPPSPPDRPGREPPVRPTPVRLTGPPANATGAGQGDQPGRPTPVRPTGPPARLTEAGQGGWLGLPEPARLDELPLSLAVAAFLLARLDVRPGRLVAVTVPGSLGPGAAAVIGRGLVGGEGARGRVGMVVMGDLSARRTGRAPGAFHPGAAAFDASVAEAFRVGQLTRLLDLEPGRAADLSAGGRVPLQVLAGAFQDAPGVDGRVLYEDAPYGVGYLVGLLAAR